uniref:tRNA (Cytosine(38)-C(5))-methyltransferase n=1 Tax=Ananas comosus var. bracteatus TaxID=296719 RepID=A0A6V7NZL6_ANACO|nr:unnamed protein product [Ananas comosus var. bracteatus]
MEEPWRILEFYSGIGAMRYSLIKAGVRGEVVEAFDINDRANDVYEHNFSHRPFQGNIQILTAADLDKYRARAWLLSPPCQPYTRQGLKKHSADARASSFIKILDLMPHMLQPPLLLFVENVVGFEISDTHKQLMEVLARLGFVTQEYILSPLQFGIPYSRPRYFCLAKRKPLSFQNSLSDNKLLWTPPYRKSESTGITETSQHAVENKEELQSVCEPIRSFLEKESLYSHQQEFVGVASEFRSEDVLADRTALEEIDTIETNTSQHGEEVRGSIKKQSFLHEYVVP